MLRHRFSLYLAFVSLTLGSAFQTSAQNEIAAPPTSRPNYNLRLNLDYKLLTFSADGKITVPVQPEESLNDAVFFIYANAPGVSGNDADHTNIVVDEVTLNGAKLEYSLNGAVLRVKLPQAQSTPFTLDFKWRGVVPRAPAGSGGIMEAMGGMDLSSIFGGAATTEKKKDPDYGVYSYGNGVLSLGSFWYPSLAVRQNGKWMDEAPSGVGDVGFSEASDFDVAISPPPNTDSITTATTGNLVLMSSERTESVGPFTSDQYRKSTKSPINQLSGTGKPSYRHTPDIYQANEVRDFTILVSDQFVIKAKKIEVAGKKIGVQAYVTKAHEAKADEALDIAVNALQIYSKRFGPYPYDSFKVVEGPMRGGAGGMEYSGLVSIASFLFDDMDKQMNELAGSLGGGADMEKTLADLGLGNEGGAAGDVEPNSANDLLGGMLGQQKAVFDSLLETTIAHEVAHQWWAMGVGSDAQRAPWLDESLTNYSAMVYFEDRYGKAKAQEMLDLHLKTSYSMGRMLGGADAPVNLSTAAYANNLQYGAIVYGKGALYYDALRKLVGDEAFFGSLQKYFAQYNGKLANSRALIEIFKVSTPAKAAQIEALFKRWIEETHGDDDIAGGKVGSIADMLGGLLDGMMGE